MADSVQQRHADRRTALRLEDYLDSGGRIVLPDDANLTLFLDRNIADFGRYPAYRFLDYTDGGDAAPKDLTYDQLGIRLRAVGARLQQIAARGDRVAILAPQGLDYVIGFFAAIKAGMIAVPLFAPELAGHAERLTAVLGDSQPSVVLTTTDASAAVQAFLRKLAREQRPRVIAIDAVPDTVGSTFSSVPIRSSDIAYLQYTSGSTRTPAGVEVTHRAAVTNVLQMILGVGLDFDIRSVSWLPLYHDMGLMFIMFPALFGGLQTLMSPVAFVRRPLRWIRALAEEAKHGRTFAAAPNFAFELAAQRGVPPAGADLDLSNVAGLINGSEPINLESIRRFNAAFAPYGLKPTTIMPSYGLAEATLFVSTIAADAEPTATFLDRDALSQGRAVVVDADAPNSVVQVSCGQVSPSQWAVIVDEDGNELPDGRVGEIWLHGNNIGRGYWGRPDESKATFGNKLRSRLAHGSHATTAPPNGPWLRTGDLGVYLDGELYITGRIKDVIIIDGRNHYPQDIEWTTAQASAGIRRGYVAAFSVPANEIPGEQPSNTDTTERLVIVAERAPGTARTDPESITSAVRAAVSRRHGLAAADVKLVHAGAIPRTTSGKLARRACRAEYLNGALGGFNGE